MKQSILSLFLGIGIWGGLMSSPATLCAQGGATEYVVKLDLNSYHLYQPEELAGRTNISVESFDNTQGFTDSTGCVSGGSYLLAQGTVPTIKPSLPIAIKGHNLWAGTYDVYVVMVPYYYQFGQAPSTLDSTAVKPNKIRVTMEYLDSISATRPSSVKSSNLVYEGKTVDTICVFEDFQLPIHYYGCYENVCPTITIGDAASSSEVNRKNYTRELRVDQIILKAKSVTPGPTVFEGSFGEGLTYKLDTNTGALTLSGSGELKEVPTIEGIVASEIKRIVVDEGITSLGEGVFAGMDVSGLSLPKSLKAIGKKAFCNAVLSDFFTFPASVEAIGDSAFYGTNLRTLELPEGLKAIGEKAFYNNPLTEVEIPGGVEAIGNQAFGNTNISVAKLPESAATLGEDLFVSTPLHMVYWNVRNMELDVESCDPFRSVRAQIDTVYFGTNVEVLPDKLCQFMSLREIVLSEKLQTIGAKCFYACPYQEVIAIPASVKTIGTLAFGNTKHFEVAAGNTAYTDVDGVLFSKDKKELVCYPYGRIESYRIPEGTTAISKWAFGRGYENIHIPASVTTLSFEGFGDVRSITTEWTRTDELPTLQDLAMMEGYTAPFMVQVPYGSKEVYQQAEGWKNCQIVYELVVGKALVANSTFSLFRQLLEATGWDEALTATEDEEYTRLYNEGAIRNLTPHPTFRQEGTAPARRKYGFTMFAEKNAVFEALIGKAADAITLQDLTTYLTSHYEGKTDADYTSEEHVLNRFVSYHLLPVKLPYDKMVIHYNELGYNYARANAPYTIPVMEYYETLGKGRRLLKMSESRGSNGVRINRFAKIDCESGYEQTVTNEGLAIAEEGSVVASALNGLVYGLDELLVYSDEVRNRLSNERMRHDITALLPEMSNNDLRRPMTDYEDGATKARGFDLQVYPYFENLTLKEGANCYYLTGLGQGWRNYQGDEFCITGKHDLIIKLPAVPANGTYELRIGNSSNSVRSITQFYFGEDKENLVACGLPKDMRKGGRTLYTTGNPLSDAGWEADGRDEVVNQMVDLQMREKGYLKGSKSYSASPGYSSSMRNIEDVLRLIVGQFNLKAGETYYLRLKSCLEDTDKELYLDFIEWVPQSVYDNPNEPEDRW